jgi:HK97 gp10 family phage protein
MAELYSLEWLGDDVIKQIEKEGDGALFAGAEVLLDVAQSKAPVDDGDLVRSGYVATARKSTYTRRRGHRKEIRPDAGVAVMAFAMFYAHIVEIGAKPHRIKARPGKRLRIGKSFVTEVRHPGTRGQPFIRPALDESGAKIAEAIAAHFRKNVK